MARAFRWEGDAAVAHLDELELEALADGATAVITILGEEPGAAVTGTDAVLPELSGGPTSSGGASAEDDLHARFEALTAGLTPSDPELAVDPVDPAELHGGDPALSRLLPAAHTSDVAAARDFAALAHDGIRATKVANLRALVAACERSRESGVMALNPREARQVMAAFTDVRLVLADRLGIHEDHDAERVDAQTSELIRAVERGETLSDADEVALQLGIHHGFVGWMQETLVEALLRH
ncbi:MULTISPECIES: DUF2017 family protein [Kytococcus]|uniref:DUF2017 domain-containing protein n=1 Tax=Kytococcus schroeteri TaxID=138300 RepID=A0A2I1PBI0_9MICO|nr:MULTISPECIES: DUF2017 family protein [Kytococcus]OFS14162.1 hypothetical protein HMPREF3099_04685 [Kytococcus sp. HMSC28H12]PKZ41977.1 DUF2017 domain-containing protein [Kytococcus schroeteri]